jgi:hypothetical protein
VSVSFQRALASRERTLGQSDEEGATFTSAGWQLYNATMDVFIRRRHTYMLMYMHLLSKKIMSQPINVAR